MPSCERSCRLLEPLREQVTQTIERLEVFVRNRQFPLLALMIDVDLHAKGRCQVPLKGFRVSILVGLYAFCRRGL